MRLTLTFLALLMIPGPVYCSGSGVNLPVADIPGDLVRFYERSNPHKIYLHLNKNHFNSGDVIWFKAYLIDAVNHKPDTSWCNIHVDLINSDGIIMGKRLLLAKNGTATGDLNLPVSLPDGNYMVRAYTDRMMSIDQSQYFTRNLYIYNPGFKNSIPRLKVMSNRRFNKQLDMMKGDYNIGFYPEGGHLITGIMGRVAVRAVDGLGQGVEVTGEVLSPLNEVVAKFGTSASGTGSFEFTPRGTGKYLASVSVKGEKPVVAALPEVRSAGFTLRLTRDSDQVFVKIISKETSGGFYSGKEILLFAHSGGNTVFNETVAIIEGKGYVTIPENELPSGIVHFTLFSQEGETLAERLILNDQGDAFNFIPVIVSQVIDGKVHYGLVIEVTDKNNNPVKGSFSVSLLAGEFEEAAPVDNIVSYILFSSELDVPVYYTADNIEVSSPFPEGVDDLMIASGLSGFSWDEVFSENSSGMTEPHSGISITGRLTEPERDETLGNYPVELKIDGDDEIYATYTNRRGIFEFNDLVYYDETRVRISSKKLKDNSPPNIELFQAKTEGYEYVPDMYTRPNNITGRSNNWRRIARITSSPYSEAPELKALPRLYGIPDQTIFIDLKSVRQNSVYEVLLHRARGVDFEGGGVRFRARTDLFMSPGPMFMLDGVRTDSDVVLGMTPLDVQRLELFRGTSKSAFGSRGSNGVIIAYSRRAADKGFSDYNEYSLLGYHTPNEFYTDISTFATGSSAERYGVRTLKWDPDVNTDSNGQAIIPIPSIEGIGPVRLVIEGMGMDGGTGSGIFMLHYE